MKPFRFPRFQYGSSLLEALITVVILAIGLLSLAAFQAKVQATETDSFQRAQALLLVQDMANRISTNRANAASYMTSATSLIGSGDSQPTDCSATPSVAAKDICEWSNELKGAAEKSAANTKIGAMIGARGCVDLVVGSNPPSYVVSVAWQGMTEFKPSALTCANTVDYGGAGFRRVLANRVTFGNLRAP